MGSSVTIAIDAMGGDYGPSVTVPAALNVLSGESRLAIKLVGLEDQISPFLKKNHLKSSRISIVPASQTVEMGERPVDALRKKKDSSLRVAANLVRDGEADAFVSAGNTGAMMAISRYVLKTLPGIERPAIISTFPTMGGHCQMLDLGANVDCKASNFYQFALMGSILAKELHGKKNPTVGLLNIGEEKIKGNEQVKQANALLQQSMDTINYVGYVEGDAMYAGEVDIVVCDGFVGNVALKVSEGLATMIADSIKKELRKSWLRKLLVWPARPLWVDLKSKLDPGNYNGASMVGLRGIAVKSHGNASAISFSTAIRRAMTEVEKQVPKLIEEGVRHLQCDIYSASN